MEVVDAIKNRYSVRGFLNKEVEKDTVKKIIELAKMAPSGVNLSLIHISEPTRPY